MHHARASGRSRSRVTLAQRHEHLAYRDLIERNLKVMDTSAVVLCEENAIPIRVFDLHQRGNLTGVMRGEPIGTLIDGTGGAKPAKK